MTLRLTTMSVAGLMMAAAALKAGSQALGGVSSPASQSPALINTCLITNDVTRLIEFYRRVLRIPPKTAGADYAEFPTGGGVLAIFSAEAHEK
ncbi:MAG: hypothetical protein ABSH24_33305 [Bryobacteraceae bacterium]